MSEIELYSEDDTAKLAAKVYQTLKGGECIALSGPLGAGKTAFTRYLAAAAGVKEGSVSSPSFVLSNEYQGEKFLIEHWDLYRLFDEPEELYEPPAKNVIRIIEWPERAPELKRFFDLYIEIAIEDGGDIRKVTISGDKAAGVNI